MKMLQVRRPHNEHTDRINFGQFQMSFDAQAEQRFKVMPNFLLIQLDFSHPNVQQKGLES